MRRWYWNIPEFPCSLHRRQSGHCITASSIAESNFSERLFVGLRNSPGAKRERENHTEARIISRQAGKRRKPYREHYRVIPLLQSGKQGVSLTGTNTGRARKRKERSAFPFVRQLVLLRHSLTASVCILRRGSRMKYTSAGVCAANSFSFSSDFHLDSIEMIERALLPTTVKFLRRDLRDSR